MCDSGFGMKDEECQNLSNLVDQNVNAFNRFNSLNGKQPSYHERYIGLGLFVTSQLVKMNDGQIGFISDRVQPLQGTTFMFKYVLVTCETDFQESESQVVSNNEVDIKFDSHSPVG